MKLIFFEEADQSFEVEGDYSEKTSGVKQDAYGHIVLSGKAEEFSEQHEVSGRADRKKFSYPLDNGKNSVVKHHQSNISETSGSAGSDFALSMISSPPLFTFSHFFSMTTTVVSLASGLK
jgi:hypothetical protein